MNDDLSDATTGKSFHQTARKTSTSETEPFTITKKLLVVSSGQFDVGSIRELTLTQLNIERIDQVHKCYNLEILDLSHNQISIIEKLESLTKLRTLRLSYNRISKLEGIDNLKSLTHLDMESNNISNLKELAILSHLVKLKTVNFKNNPITIEREYESLVKRNVPNLKYIDGDHILLRIPSMAYQDDHDQKPLQTPEERSWTVMKNGKSIWDTDTEDVPDLEVQGVTSLEKTIQGFSNSITECRKLLAAAQSLDDNLRKHL